jgi:hypothetical protein
MNFTGEQFWNSGNLIFYFGNFFVLVAILIYGVRRNYAQMQNKMFPQKKLGISNFKYLSRSDLMLIGESFYFRSNFLSTSAHPPQIKGRRKT